MEYLARLGDCIDVALQLHAKRDDDNVDLHSKDVRQARVITVHSFVGAMAAQGLGFPQLKDPTSVAVSKFTFQTLSSVRHHSNGVRAVTIPTRRLVSLAVKP